MPLLPLPQQQQPLPDQVKQATEKAILGGELRVTLQIPDADTGREHGHDHDDPDEDEDDGDRSLIFQSKSASASADASASASGSASAEPVPATASVLTYGSRVAKLREDAIKKQGVAQFLNAEEDANCPAVSKLLAVCRLHIDSLRAHEAAQTQALHMELRGRRDTNTLLEAHRKKRARENLACIKHTWTKSVGPVLREAREWDATWQVLLENISQQCAGDSTQHHPSDLVVDVQGALTQARALAEARARAVTAGEPMIPGPLDTALVLAGDLCTLCDNYLEAVTSWRAVATQAELEVMSATARACTQAIQDEFLRRATRTVAACRTAIQTLLAVPPLVHDQTAVAAYNALCSRAALELAQVEMSVHGMQTPWDPHGSGTEHREAAAPGSAVL